MGKTLEVPSATVLESPPTQREPVVAALIPTGRGTMHADFLLSLLMTRGRCDYIHVKSGAGGLIDVIRNELVQDALVARDITHLWFLDDDMKFPPNTLERLLAHDVDIVSALAFGRAWPYKPNALLRDAGRARYDQYAPLWVWDAEPRGLLRVDATGLACQLCKVGVFREMEPPWFDHQIWNEGGKIRALGEDFVFCERAIEAGFDIYTDTSLPIEHLGEDWVDETTAALARDAIVKDGGGITKK